MSRNLIKWIGAKHTTAELVSNISATESEVRCKLAWQEFDHCLWLASLSSVSELSQAQLVADPEAFVANGKNLDFQIRFHFGPKLLAEGQYLVRTSFTLLRT